MVCLVNFKRWSQTTVARSVQAVNFSLVRQLRRRVSTEKRPFSEASYSTIGGAEPPVHSHWVRVKVGVKVRLKFGFKVGVTVEV